VPALEQQVVLGLGHGTSGDEEQRGGDLDGTHQGDFVSRDLRGTIDGDAVRIRRSWEHGDSLNYTFSGNVRGDEFAGDVSLGEYLDARFSAKRHASGRA
jgi:L-seryl-tRNA(Ser) seleniumtransferase